MEEYSIILKRHSLKVTPQRVAILEYLMSSYSHPTAEVIFSDLMKVYPSMSLATVYKTLDTLRSEGIILEINTGEDSNRYDSNTSQHAHSICLGCNTVTDIKLPHILENIDSEMFLSHGFSVLDKRMFFYGYCQGCKDKQSAGEEYASIAVK